MSMDFPQKNKKRAERRRQKKLKYIRALKVAKRINPHADETWYDRWATRSADNLTVCSCHMCGNPRKHFKDATMQEKKWKISIDLNENYY